MTMSATPALNSFQMLVLDQGTADTDPAPRLMLRLTRQNADQWYLEVSYWNETTGTNGSAGAGFLACATAVCGNLASWHNNRIDFEWRAGNPGHITVWRTRYIAGAPDWSGRVQILSADLPGMGGARINSVFAGMYAGQDPGTYGALYLDELSFSDFDD
jgi:hypothetical protein